MATMLTMNQEQIEAMALLEQGKERVQRALSNYAFIEECGKHNAFNDDFEEIEESLNAYNELKKELCDQKFNFEFAIEVAKQAIKMVVEQDGDVDEYFEKSKLLVELKENFKTFLDANEIALAI